MSILQCGDYEFNYVSEISAPCLVPSPLLEKKIDWSCLYPFNAEQRLPQYAIHLHLFYLDSIKETCYYLARTCMGANLLVTTDQHEKADLLLKLLRSAGIDACFETIKVIVMPNAGRNIWPLLNAAFKELSAFPLVLHLHTKMSLHAEIGRFWMGDLLDCLIGNEKRVQGIRTAFANNDSLGVILPRQFHGIRPYLNWGSNYDIAKLLCSQIFSDRDLSSISPLAFPAGMMFWFRPTALASLHELTCLLSEPPPEPLPLDGTSLHAIERLVLHACEYKGYGWAFCGNDRNEAEDEVEKPILNLPSISVWNPDMDNYIKAATNVIHTLHQRDRILAGVERSLSWRLTTPLRSIRRFVKDHLNESVAGT